MHGVGDFAQVQRGLPGPVDVGEERPPGVEAGRKAAVTSGGSTLTETIRTYPTSATSCAAAVPAGSRPAPSGRTSRGRCAGPADRLRGGRRDAERLPVVSARSDVGQHCAGDRTWHVRHPPASTASGPSSARTSSDVEPSASRSTTTTRCRSGRPRERRPARRVHQERMSHVLNVERLQAVDAPRHPRPRCPDDVVSRLGVAEDRAGHPQHQRRVPAHQLEVGVLVGHHAGSGLNAAAGRRRSGRRTRYRRASRSRTGGPTGATRPPGPRALGRACRPAARSRR